jgi:hypothetical protein
MRTLKWREIKTDEEFTALFKGHTIVETMTWLPDEVANKLSSNSPYVDLDLIWKLDTGQFVAVHFAQGGGCDTCGWGGDEKAYYLLENTSAAATND